jgi:hypothetical protein
VKDLLLAPSGRIVGKQEVETSAPFGGAELANHQQQTPVAWRLCTSCSFLAAILPRFPGRLQLPVPLRVDLLLPPRQHVPGRDVAVALFRRTFL